MASASQGWSSCFFLVLLLFPHHDEEFDLPVAMQEPSLQLASALWLYNMLVNCKSFVAQLSCLEAQSCMLCREQGSWKQ